MVGTPAKLSRQTRNGTPIQTPSRITDYFARHRNRGGSCHHRHRSRECPARSQHGYISVVTPPQRWQSPEQQAQRHAQYEARVKSLLAIALKDERVQALLAGKNYTVVGIAIPRPLPPPPGAPARSPNATRGTTARFNTSSPVLSPGAPPIGHASLVLRVEDKFYRIDIDITHETVTSVTQRSCYGPACNG